MKLDYLCTFELEYLDYDAVEPYAGPSGPAWGHGQGTFTGKRLSGNVRWSNHPTMRGDGAMLPDLRGVVTTGDGAKVVFNVTGRTVWVKRDGQRIGEQLFMMLLESDNERYAWLNGTVCICEGLFDPDAGLASIDVFTCRVDSDSVAARRPARNHAPTTG